MTKPSTTTQPQVSRGWSSLLSGAVTSLESKLDTILADDDQASARARAAEEASKRAKAADKVLSAKSQMVYQAQVQPASQAQGDGTGVNGSGTPVRNTTRGNDRLQARLARAVGRGASGTNSERGSRESSISTSGRTVRKSGEEKREDGSSSTGTGAEAERKDSPAEGGESIQIPASGGNVENTALSTEDQASLIKSLEADTTSETPPPILSPEEQELKRVKEEHSTEINEYLEKIDALHAKVAYLSAQKSQEAEAEVAAAPDSSVEKKNAEKDAKIAQLLQEGEKLSRNEMKHLSALKKLRGRLQEEERSATDLKKLHEKAETEAKDLRDSLKASEAREKAAEDRSVGFVEQQRQLENLKMEKAEAIKEIHELRREVDEAEKRADEAAKKVQTEKLEEQRRRIGDLEEEVANSKIEKKLVEDRVKKEMQNVKDEYKRQAEKGKLTEMELKSEVQVCNIPCWMK
jgi:hypothetical protein